MASLEEPWSQATGYLHRDSMLEMMNGDLELFDLGQDSNPDSIPFGGGDQFLGPNCNVCQSYSLFCLCLSESATVNPSVFNHEAVPQQRPEMESNSGALAPASHAATLPANPHTDFGASGMTASASTPQNADAMDANFNAGSRPDWIDTPGSARYVSHIQGSNVRGSLEEQAWGADTNDAMLQRNNLHASNIDTWGYDWEAPEHGDTGPPLFEQDAGSNFVLVQNNSAVGMQHFEEATNNPEPDNPNAVAYAKLVFPDGDYLIKTYDVVLGRNMKVQENARLRKQQAKKAQRAVDAYRKEPSQPSQYDDEEQRRQLSSSSHSRDDSRRVAPSIQSGLGGISWHPPKVDENSSEGKSRRRKSQQYSQHSSTGSIAPANLHVGTVPGEHINVIYNAQGEPEERTSAFVPVHTAIDEDITKLSKEHLLIRYNFAKEVWELLVLGNGAFLNKDHIQRGEVTSLEHNDEILVSTLRFMFKLPDNYRRSPGLSRGTFSMASDDEDEDNSDDDVGEPGTSPARRLSNAVQAGDSDDDEDDAQIQDRKPSTKPHKKTKPKDGKKLTADKSKKPKKESAEKSPEATKKKPKDKEPKDASPTEPPVIKPGSMLADIPLEEMPQKRKGPGRPPKEGNVSKRDQSFANKKMKEMKKMGLEIPPYHEIVDMVRRENKEKEMRAKALQNGQPLPEVDVVQSIEKDATNNAAAPNSKASGIGNPSETPGEEKRKASPKPKRLVKTPSPMPAESEFTEEQLQRPNLNYVQMINEVLTIYPGGKADLQTIYDLIQKRYPYYKYRSGGVGWQSSVRHNLAQVDRFKGDEKLAKGKLWEIDYSVPLEKEKKRKLSPPRQMPPNGPPMAGPSQPGQMPYGNPYSQQQQNGPFGPQSGPNTYSSPYAQPGQQSGNYGGPPPHMTGPNGTQQAPRYPPQPNHIPPPPQPQGERPPEFGDLIKFIMHYRIHYLQPVAHDPNVCEFHSKKFYNIMEIFSELYPKPDRVETLQDARAKLETDFERLLFDGMYTVFNRYQSVFEMNANGNAADVNGSAAGAVQQAQQAGANQADGSAPAPQAQAQAQAQPEVPQAPALGPGAGTKRPAEDDAQEAKRARNDEGVEN